MAFCQGNALFFINLPAPVEDIWTSPLIILTHGIANQISKLQFIKTQRNNPEDVFYTTYHDGKGLPPSANPNPQFEPRRRNVRCMCKSTYPPKPQLLGSSNTSLRWRPGRLLPIQLLRVSLGTFSKLEKSVAGISKFALSFRSRGNEGSLSIWVIVGSHI